MPPNRNNRNGTGTPPTTPSAHHPSRWLWYLAIHHYAPKITHTYLTLKLPWELERTKCAQWCARRQETRCDVRVLRFPGNQRLDRAESPRGASISALKSFSRQRECGFESRPGHHINDCK